MVEAVPSPAMAATVASLVDAARLAHDRLATVGEAIEDEWQYVEDLRAVWGGRLAALAAARGSETVDGETEAAVAQAVEEASLVEDPHRAIDWLSTLPQVVLLSLGGG